MKYLLLSAFCFVMLQNILFAQQPFYNWIDRNPTELKASLGSPAHAYVKNDDSLYIYQTEIGYRSFFFHDDRIFKADNTSYWNTKKKARSAFNTLLKYYKDDGFNIENTRKDLIILSNSTFTAKLKLYYQDNWYAVSEIVTNASIN